MHSEPFSSSYLLWLFYTSLVGCILSIITGSFILINVIRKFYIKFKHRSEELKSPYIMMIVYCSLIILTALSFGFLRTNLFSRIDISSYTATYCKIGFIIGYFVSFSSLSLLHLILIYRIKWTFRGSAYAYPSYVYKTLCAATILTGLLSFTSSIVHATTASEWIIIYTPSKIFNYCRIHESQFTSKEASFRLTIVIIYGVVNLLENIALLCMFNRGLWLLNSKLVKGVMKNMERQISNHMYNQNHTQLDSGSTCTPSLALDGPHKYGIPPSPSRTPDPSKTEIPVTPSEDPSRSIPQLMRATSNGVQIMVDRYREQKKYGKRRVSAKTKRFIKLYNIMKKQSILLTIAIISSTIFFVWTGFTAQAVWLFQWDFCVNMVCTWLMLSSSEEYWNWCKTRGICWCCYRNT